MDDTTIQKQFSQIVADGACKKEEGSMKELPERNKVETTTVVIRSGTLGLGLGEVHRLTPG